jgi:hypothetical protein
MNCPDCQREMQRGFVPDVAFGCYQPAHWHPGEPETEKSFGMKVGPGVHRDPKKSIPISSYRCPKCGLLRLYALADTGDGR